MAQKTPPQTLTNQIIYMQNIIQPYTKFSTTFNELKKINMGLTHQPAAHRMIVQLQMLFTTVEQMLNQGAIRKPGCILVFGALFGYFLGKQKVTENSNCTSITKRKNKPKNKSLISRCNRRQGFH